MKTYTLPQVSTGVISESQFAFVFTLNDKKESPEDKNVLLDRYFNDIYHLFLTKFSRLPIVSQVSDEDTDALKALLEEILRVKAMLAKDE